jgi:hypothetical protein
MSGDSHILVAFQKLPDRRNLPLLVRQGLRREDVREAMVLVARKLNEEATKLNAGGRGYTWDFDDIVYDSAMIENVGDTEAVPTLVASMKVSR